MKHVDVNSTFARYSLATSLRDNATSLVVRFCGAIVQNSCKKQTRQRLRDNIFALKQIIQWVFISSNSFHQSAKSHLQQTLLQFVEHEETYVGLNILIQKFPSFVEVTK